MRITLLLSPLCHLVVIVLLNIHGTSVSLCICIALLWLTVGSLLLCLVTHHVSVRIGTFLSLDSLDHGINEWLDLATNTFRIKDLLRDIRNSLGYYQLNSNKKVFDTYKQEDNIGRIKNWVNIFNKLSGIRTNEIDNTHIDRNASK